MRKTQKTAIVGGTVAVLFAGGVAFAAWTSTGNGSGAANAGHQVDLTVTGDTAVDNLYPTLTVQVPVKIKNNNPYPVELDSITYKAAGSSTDTTGCTVANVNVVDLTAIGERIPANTQGVAHDMAVTMIANAASECQDAEFTLNFDASAHSVD